MSEVTRRLRELLDAPVPPTIAMDDEFRYIYCQGYLHALKDALAAVLDTEGDRPPDVFAAVEDVLAKHCRGYIDKPTTRENIAELIDRILTTDANRVQQMQSLQRQIDAVDKALGFPDDDGHGRVEMIQRLRADTEGDQPTPPQSEWPTDEHLASVLAVCASYVHGKGRTFENAIDALRSLAPTKVAAPEGDTNPRWPWKEKFDFCPICLGRDFIIKEGEPEDSPCPNKDCWQGLVKK
jgi:hypothetical protein